MELRYSSGIETCAIKIRCSPSCATDIDKLIEKIPGTLARRAYGLQDAAASICGCR
jgi:hypothetical protein